MIYSLTHICFIWHRLLVYMTAYFVAIAGGGLVVWLILAHFKTDEMQKKGLRNAGAVIGILERALTLTLILAGEYTAIALIFAAKSLARFNDLNNREFAEYYLIGTLSSILVAVVTGAVAGYVLRLLP